MLELDCLYNNTSFWLSLSTCEITYYLSTPSKQVKHLITLSFNHPKPTQGLDALLGPHRVPMQQRRRLRVEALQHA